MAFLDPVSTTSDNGGWFPSGAASLHEALADAVRDPTDPSVSGNAASLQPNAEGLSDCLLGLGTLASDSSNLTTWVYVRIQSNGSGTTTITVTLKVGGSTVDTFTVVGPADASIVTGWQSHAVAGSFASGQAVEVGLTLDDGAVTMSIGEVHAAYVESEAAVVAPSVTFPVADSDFDSILANSDDAFNIFEESAVYIPRTGSSRAIKVIVDRLPLATREEVDQGMSPVIAFSVANLVTDGILSTELERGDRIRMAYAYGGSETRDFVLPASPSLVDGGRVYFRIMS